MVEARKLFLMCFLVCCCCCSVVVFLQPLLLLIFSSQCLLLCHHFIISQPTHSSPLLLFVKQKWQQQRIKSMKVFFFLFSLFRSCVRSCYASPLSSSTELNQKIIIFPNWTCFEYVIFFSDYSPFTVRLVALV